MKKIISLLMVSAACLQVAYAGFKVPKSVYKMDQLEEAKAEAKQDGKALVFVYSNTGST